MRVSLSDLSAFGKAPEPLPPIVEPRLTLAEEVVVLSLATPRRRARRAVRMAGRAHPEGPRRHRAARRALAARGMVARRGFRLEPTDAALVCARTRRVLAIAQRAAAPAGADAELLVLLAVARALRLEPPAVRMATHIRVASIGPVPPAVQLVARRLRCATMPELAERLVPAPRHLDSRSHGVDFNAIGGGGGA